MDLDQLEYHGSRPTAVFGSVGESAEWQVVYKAYMADQVEAAYQAILDLGLGATGNHASWFGRVEAEALSRKHSEIRTINNWLQVETIPNAPEGLDQFLLQRCEKTARRLGFTEHSDLLITIFAPNANTPWTEGRYGYFVPKTPRAKICLPIEIVGSPTALAQTLDHEYSHLITETLASGRAPRWVNEGVAVLMEGGPDLRFINAFAGSQVPWQTPVTLELAFSNSQNLAHEASRLSLAYQQSGIIVAHLAKIKGERSIGDLLRAYSDNSVWQDLKLKFTGQTPTDEAIRQVFGISTEELFSAAKPRNLALSTGTF